jgi:hypothetical protein
MHPNREIVNYFDSVQHLYEVFVLIGSLIQSVKLSLLQSLQQGDQSENERSTYVWRDQHILSFEFLSCLQVTKNVNVPYSKLDCE